MSTTSAASSAAGPSSSTSSHSSSSYSSSSGQTNNPNLAAKICIQKVGQFSHPPQARVVNQLKHLAKIVENGFKLDPFPDRNAGFREMGEWTHNQYLNICSMVNDDSSLPDVVNPPKALDRIDVAAIINKNQKCATILASAIRKWLSDASAYEANRIQSATKQMRNNGESEDAIRRLVGDKEALRRYIHAQRSTLLLNLSQAKELEEKDDVFNLPDTKQSELLVTHSNWFNKAEAVEDNPYPNDNAVPYTILILEIMILISKHGGSKKGNLWVAYTKFLTIFLNQAQKESNTKAWTKMKTIRDFVVEGYNIGAAMVEYTTNVSRNQESDKASQSKKLNSALQVTVRRLLRIGALSQECTNQFTILNLEGDELIDAIVELNAREERAEVAIRAANNIQPGADGLRDSEWFLWTIILNRKNLLPILMGCNHLTTPGLAGSLVGVDTSMFPALQPRPWAITAKRF